MSKITETFPTLIEGADPSELSYIESYVFVGKTPEQWITEAENTPGLISDDPMYQGEPINQSIMTMSRTAIIVAREEYKNL